MYKSNSKPNIIRPRRLGIFDSNHWIDLFQYRDLLYMFCWREYKARYKQTALGITWALVQPFVTMVIFSLLLNHAGGINTENEIPYPIYVFSGTLVWQVFSSSLSRGSPALVDQKSLISKVYFPRVYLIIAPITIAIADFFFASIILIGLYVHFGIAPHLSNLIFFPFFSLWLCSLCSPSQYG